MEKTRDSKGKFLPGYTPKVRRRAGSKNKISQKLVNTMGKESPEVIQAVIDAAKGGDVPAAKVVLSYIMPRSKTGKLELLLPEIVGTESLVDASAKIIGAIATGAIALDHGLDLQKLITAHKELLESHDLERRIEEIEAFTKAQEVN